MRIGFAIGMVASGLGVVIARVANSDHTAFALVVALVGTGAFCGINRIGSSRRGEWLSHGHGHALPPTEYRGRRALVRGILDALFGVAVVALLVGALGWALGAGAEFLGLGALWLGLGAATALGARDLRRWQELNGLAVFTNAAGPRFAFTQRQSARSMVLVERPADVVRSPRPQDATA